MAFKGTLPSDLWLKYSVQGGRHLMNMDLIVAGEINDRITDATSEARKNNPKGMVARRNQKREQRKFLSNNNDLLDILSESGVPIIDKRSEGSE